MKILKTMVGAGNKILQCDTIEHEGKIWLVPKWLASPAEGVQRPERIVRIDLLPHQKLDRKPGGIPADYVLNVPIPRDVLDGPILPGKGSEFEVVPQPDIQVLLPRNRPN
jgi:hypothetical protein